MKSNFLGIIIICAIIFILLYVFYRKKFKKVLTPSYTLITGGIKTGKTLLCLNLAMKEYKKIHFRWRFRRFFGHDEEEPLFYTVTNVSFNKLNGRKHKLDKNIMMLTTDHILRKVRFNYESVCFIDEVSLLANNMDFKDRERNAQISLFVKLFAHMTKGGRCYCNTQGESDLHYALKRNASTYFFITKDRNLKLFHILLVRELVNTEIGNNNFNEDTDDSMKLVLVPFWWHYKYNRYEFSYLTDDLDKKNNVFKPYGGIISFDPIYIKIADTRKKGDDISEK